MDFDLPDAKRVRRSDLYTSTSHTPSPSSSRPQSPDPTLSSALQSRLAALYGPITLAPNSSAGLKSSDAPKRSTTSREEDGEPEPGEAGAGVQEAAEGKQEFEFRLFSGPSASAPALHRIILHDEDAEPGAGGFVRRERDRGFYIAARAQGEAKERYAFAARSGEEVVRGSRARNWGLEVPWRVAVLRASSLKRQGKEAVAVTVGADQRGDVKKKPGKKRRIVLRERRRKKLAQEERKRKETESKEEAEREKKTRRNREKKVKRKMKEKALKAAGGGTLVGDVEGGQSGSD